MTENLLPNLLTRVGVADLYAALRAAWPDGTRASVLVLLSQWSLETGRGASCHAWNLGNLKHVPGDGHDYCQFRCNEVLGGKTVWFDPPHPATSFRAYASLTEGVADYLHVLQKTFARAWPSVLAGDAAGFARALYLAHYYTADPAVYARNLVALFAEFDAAMPADADPAGLAHDAIAQAELEVDETVRDPPPDEPA